jgi:hypothetical protein
MSKSANIWIRYNSRIIEWTRETWSIQSRNLQTAIKKGTDKTLSSLQFVNGRDAGMIDYAAFKFERTAIFIEKGVGGVYKIDPEGSGIVRRTTPGELNRKPSPWIGPALDIQMPKLTSIVSNEFSKVVSGTLADALQRSVKLKGIA